MKNKDNANSKSIFIGGFVKSGKTLIRNLLNKHREIAAFCDTKLVETKAFLDLPMLIFKCPPHLRAPLLNIFKQLCTTYFYCRLMWPRGSWRDKAWLYYEKLWLSRLQFPQSFLWNNPIWSILEKLWIPKLLKRFVCPSYHKKGSLPVGWRGLYNLFKKKDIKQCFVHLVPLNEVSTLNEAYCIYGEFWSCLFKGYAKKQKKKYWAVEEPQNCLYHILFLKQCFNGFKLINLIRDGRDAACFAYEKWGVNMSQSLYSWAKILTKVLKDQANMTSEDYINIRYEDLVGNTRITLKKITDFLGVDLDETMLSFPINSATIGQYKYIFNSELKNYAKEQYGSLLNQWGYLT